MRFRPSPALPKLLTIVAAACSDPGGPATPTAAAPFAGAPNALTAGTGVTTSLRSVSAAGRCLDISGGDQTPGTGAILYQCHFGANQQFTWQANGEIRVYGSMCLDAQSGEGGSPVVIHPCNGGASQLWTATAAREIRGLNGRCLDVLGDSREDRAAIHMYDCHGGNNQKWENGGVARAPADPVPDGTPIYPGENIQAKVAAAAPGTTFILKAGTHVRQSVVPKSGMTFVGERGAVLDGQNVTPYAFWPGNARPFPADVRIQGLVIERYAPPLQMGAVRAGGHAPGDGARGWVVQDNEIRYNAASGLRIAHGMRALRNHIHHNGQLGVGGVGDSVLLEGNEIAHNNTRGLDPGFEAGGTKFVYSRWLTARGNFVHHNAGPGLWTDGNNIDVLYENNRVEDNTGMGIFHEISYRAVIRNNQVRRNGMGQCEWAYGAGILVAASGDVEVYGNEVADNCNAITLIQQNRTADDARYGPHLVQNVDVHDNVITPGRGFTGIAQDIGDRAVFTSRNNRFRNNTYYLGASVRPFAWDNASRSEAEWRAFGQDVAGVLKR